MKALRLHNRESVVFSATAASTGGHRSLAYVPGATLWGRAAARLYADRSPDTVGQRFGEVHSGALRFGPGFPLSPSGRPAFPMPQSLQQPKHDASLHVGEQLNIAVWNTAHPSAQERRTELGQGEAIKGAFLSAAGEVVRPRRAASGKTAVIEDARRAAEAQFFQYEHLAPGQDWLAWIDGEAGAAGRAADALAGQGRLGRSKMKAFGGGFMAKVEEADDPRTEGWPGPAAPAGGDLVLWCLSDLAIVDVFGSPDLAPSLGSLLGRAVAAELDLGRSAVGTRRYAPYNGWLHAHDREHAVIEGGSVLVYCLREAVALSDFRDALGLWRERGLGMVWPNPPLLMALHPGEGLEAPPKSARGPAGQPTPSLGAADQRLLAVLRERAKSRLAAKTVEIEAAKLIVDLKRVLAIARKRGERVPTATQWALVATAADRAANMSALALSLRHAKNGHCAGERNPEWGPLTGTLARLLGPYAGEPGGAVMPAASVPQPAIFARAAWRLRATEGE